MGEYMLYRGERVKIGTCESLYYLREDQRHELQPCGDADVNRHLDAYRFRFPFPDEDNIQPGHFEDHDRALWLHLELPALQHVDHYKIQFVAQSHGYNVCLPCPQSSSPMLTVMQEEGIAVHRNGFRGNVGLVQQAYRGGRLVAIMQCNCGAAFNLPTLDDVQPVLDELERKAAYDEHQGQIHPEGPYTPSSVEFYREIARRIVKGYETELS